VAELALDVDGALALLQEQRGEGVAQENPSDREWTTTCRGSHVRSMAVGYRRRLGGIDLPATAAAQFDGEPDFLAKRDLLPTPTSSHAEVPEREGLIGRRLFDEDDHELS